MSGHRAKERRRTAGAVRLTTHQLTAAGLLTGALVPLAATAAFALPEGGTIAAGSATVSTPTATSMRIEQASDRLIMDWTRFNIAAQESVHFQQPSAAAIALNRVSGQEPSAIFGSLSATGQLFLLNPSGILFGPSSRVDVGALTASTLAMSNQDFLAGEYRFRQDPSAANAAVVNQGLITAGPGGYVALLGAAAHNDGVIQAQLGSIALASGKAATLDLRGDGLIQFVLTDAVSGRVTGPDGTALAAVSNTGTLQADGGMVTLHAKAAAGLVRSVVNQEGVVRATSLVNHGGVIKLVAEGTPAMVSNTGTLDVSAGEANAASGTITVHSDQAINLAGTVTSGAGAIALSAPEIQSTADINAGAVSIQATDLTLTGGRLTAASGSINVAHAFTQTGSRVAPGAATITVGGNWTHTGGTFDPGTSTVVFSDASQSSTVLGDNTFYNFTSVTPSKKLLFEGGATQTILGAFTIKGEKFHLVDLRSTDPGGEQWRLNPRGAVDVSFVHLGDALNLGPTLIKALPSNSYGNNTGWDTDPIWTAVGPGNWSTDANWDTGLHPGAADTVTFDATSVTNSTVDVGFAGTIGNLNINAGYTGTIDLARSLTITTTFSQADGAFNGAGSAMTVNAFTLSGGTFTSTSGTLTVTGPWTHTAGGTFQHNSGTVVAAGNSLPWDVAGTETFNHLTVNKPFESLHIAAGDTLVVGGFFTHTEGGIYTGTVQAQGAVMVGAAAGGGTAMVQITSAGAQTIEGNGGTLPNVQVSKPSGTLSLGTTNITVGSLTIDAGNTLSGTTGTLTVMGAWANTAGGTFLHNGGTVVAAGNNLPWDVNGTETFNNFTAFKTFGESLNIALGDTFIVGGTFTHTEGGINTGTVQAQGAVMVGGAAGGGTAMVQITSAGAQTIEGNGGTLPNVQVSKPSGTLSLGTTNITVGSLTIDAGNTLSGTTGTLTVMGAWTNTAGGTFLHNGGTVVAAGNNLPWDVNATETFNNFTVNKTFGEALHIALGDTLIVSGTFMHTEGAVNTGTIAARGNVVIDVTAGGGTALLSFTGTADQTYTQSGDVVDGLVTINKASGTVTLASAATWNGASQDLTVTSGTLDLAGFALSTGTLTVAAAGTVLQGSGTITASGISNAGTFSGGSSAITLSGNVTLTGGTFTSTNGTLTIQNDGIDGIPVFTHTAGGTFNHNNGTVAFTGTSNISIDVATSETFNNLTFNTTGSGGATISSGDTLVTLGTLTHSSAPLLTGTIEARGNVTVGAGAGGGDATISFLIAGDQTITSGGGVTGRLNINKPSGTVSVSGADLGIFAFTLAAGTFTAPTGILTIHNDGINGIPVFTHTAGGTFNHNNGTVAFTGTSNISVDVATSETFNNLTFNTTGGGGATLSGDTLVVLGTLTQNFQAIYTGTIEARGDVVIGAGANGGDAILNFTGTTNQTYTETGDVINGLVTINKASGTVTLASAATWNGASQNLTLTSGTLDLAGFALSTGNFTVSGGAFTGSSGTVDINGAFNQSNGTFAATSGSMTVSGDFTHAGGTFTHNSGTVTLDGTNQTVSGSTTFNHLSKTETVNDATDSILTFAAGATQTILGTLTLDGLDADDRINLVSGTPGTQWRIDPQGTRTIDYLDVQDSYNINTTRVNAIGTNSVNSGNNSGWSFVAPANFTWIGDGVDTNWLTTANWQGGVVPGAANTAIFDGNSSKNAAINTNANVAGLQLNTGYKGTVTQGAANTVTVGTSNYSQADGTFTGSSTAITVNGAFTLSGGTFTSTTGTLSVSGNWTHTGGGTFTHNNGTVNLAGFSATADVAASETFNNLIVNRDISANYVQTIATGDTLIVLGTFTHTKGILNTGTVEARGNVVLGGTGTNIGTGTISFLVAGDQTITGNGGTTAGININKPSGTVSAGTTDLRIAAFTLSAGAFTSTTGTLTVGGNWTHTAGGTFSHNNGTVNLGAGINSAFTADVAASETFNNLSVSMNSTAFYTYTIAAGDTLISLGTFTHIVGRLMGPGIVEARGNVVNSVSAQGGTGLLTFAGTANQIYTRSGDATDGLVTVNKASGTVTLASSALWNAASQNLTVTSGTLDLAGFDLSTVTLTVGAAGILQLQGAETITATTVTLNAGSTVRYYGTAAAYTLKNYSYKNLIVDGGAAPIFSFPANLTSINTLTLSNSITSLAGFNLTATTLVNNATLRLQGNETVTLTTMDLDSGTVEYVGRNIAENLTVKDFSATDYYNLVINDTNVTKATFQPGAAKVIAGALSVTSGTYDANGQTTTVTGVATVNGGTYTAGSATQTFNGGLTVSSGTFTGSTGTVDVNGTVTISGTGILVAPAAAGAFTVSGNFDHAAGTFAHNSGTVTLDGINQTISGSTTFNNLSKTETTNDATDSILTFAAGTTQTIVGTLTLNGLDADDRINLVSSIPGTQWQIDAQGTRFMGFLDVQDSHNINVVLMNGFTSSINSGNNIGWNFVAPAAFTWIGEGVDTSWLTTANWQGGVVPGAANSPIFDGTSSRDSLVVAGFAGTIANLTINTGYTGTITLARSLTLNNAFLQAAGTFSAGNHALTIDNGDFTLSGGTFTAPSSSLGFTASGAPRTFTINGGTFTHNAGTVQFGVTNNYGVTMDVPANQPFNNVTVAMHDGNSGNALSVAAGKTLTVEGTLTLADGFLAAGTGIIDAKGAIVVGAGFDGATSPQGTLVLIDGAGDQSFVVPSGASLPRMTLNSTNTTMSFTPGASVNLTGDFTLQGGTFIASSGTLTVASGIAAMTFTISGGTFTHNSGTVQWGNTNNYAVTADVPANRLFNNVTVAMYDGTAGQPLTVATGQTLTVDGTLTLTNGYLGAGTGIIDAKGAIVVGAGFDGASAPQGTLVLIDGPGDQSFVVPSGASLPRMTLNSASTTMSFAPGASVNLTGDFALQAGTFTSSSGTLTVASGFSPMTFTIIGGTFTHNSGTVQFGNTNNWGVIVNVPANPLFNNVTVAMLDGIGNPLSITTGQTLTVNGTFTHTDGAIDDGTIQAQGTVVVGAGADGGTGLLSFMGTANQTYTQSGNVVDGLITVNKASGTVTLASAATWNAAGQNLTVTSGILDLAGFALSTGTLTVSAAGTVQLQGAETITTGAVTLNAGSTVRYYGTGAAYTLKNYAYSNLTIDGAAATVFSFPANLTSINSLTLTNSIASLAGFNLTATTLVNNATLRLQGNETVGITNMDTDSGVVEYVGDGAAGLTSFAIKDFGATDYYLLNIAGHSSESFTVSSALKLNAALTHSAGTLNLGANLTTAAGTITSNGPVSVSANVVVDTTDAGAAPGGAAMVFTGALNADLAASNRTLTLTAGLSNVSLSTAVGATQPLQTFTVASANSATLPAITTRSGGISVTATAITLNGNLSTDATATAGSVALTSAVTLGGSVTIDTDAVTTDANITFSSTVNGAQALLLTAGAGDVLFSGIIGSTTPLGSLTASGGTVNLQAVTTSGGQSYTGATILNGNLNSNTAGAILVTGAATLATGPITVQTAGLAATDDITFTSTINGGQALSLTAGAADVLVSGTAGGTTPLASLTASGNTVSLQTVSTTGAQNYTGTMTLNGNLNSNTAGAITVTGAANLATGAIIVQTAGLAGTDDITFTSTINGGQALTLTAGAGDVLMSGSAGGATRLTSVTASGNTIGVQAISTTGAQSYTGSTTLNGNLSSNTAGAITVTGAANLATAAIAVQTAGLLATDDITFTSTINGGQALTLNAGTGDTLVSGSAGGTTPLAGLIASGATVGVQAVTTTGAQSYTGTTTLNGDLTTTNVAITFNSATTLTIPITLSAGTGTITAGSTLAAGAHALTVMADEIALAGGANSVTGTGSILLQPGTASLDITLGGAGGTAALDLTAPEVLTLGSGFSGITIGRAADGTGTVTVSGVTFSAPLTVIGGSLIVGGLTDSGHPVTLTARTGSIQRSGAGPDVTADTLVATAATGMGTLGSPLRTVINKIEADGGTGGVFVTNTGALTIGGIGAMVGVSATASDIRITTASPLTVDEAVTTTGAGMITLITGATGGNDDLTINAALTTGSGPITLTAGDAVALEANVSTSGSVHITAGTAITHTAGTVSGSGVLLDAATGIGSAGAPIRTAATTLAARTTGVSGIFVTEADTVDIGTVGGVSGLTTPSGLITFTAIGDVSVSQAISAGGVGAVTLTASGGVLTGTGGVTTTGDLTLNGASVGSTATPFMLGTIGGTLNGTVNGGAATDSYNVKALALTTLNLGEITAIGPVVGVPVTIDATGGSILHADPGTDIMGGRVNFWAGMIGALSFDLEVLTDNPPVMCNGSPCDLPYFVNGATAVFNDLLLRNGLSQSGRYLLGALPEEGTLLTAGVLPEFIFRCLDQDRQAVVCTAGAVWHDDDGTNGRLTAEAGAAHAATTPLVKAALPRPVVH